MRTLSDPKAQEDLMAILLSENPAARQTSEFVVGSDFLTEDFTELTCGREGEDIARVLEATVAGSIPTGLKGREVRLDLLTGAHSLRMFTGEVVQPVGGRGESSLTCSTAGYWNPSIQLGEARSYVGQSASDMAFSVILLNSRYDKHHINIDPDSSLRINREEDQMFSKVAKIDDVLGAIREEAEVFQRDTFFNGFRQSARRGPAEASEIAWEFIIGRDIDPEEGFERDEVAEEFYDVMAYRATDDGDGIEELERTLVPGSTAPPGATYEIEITDESLDAGVSVWQLVFEAAQRLMLGQYSGGFEIKYVHPLLEDGDTVLLVEPEIENGLLVTKRWYATIAANTFSMPEKSHSFEVDMTLIGVEREEPSKVPVIEALPNPQPRPLYGIDYLDSAYLSTQLSWVRFDADTGEGVIDLEEAARNNVSVSMETSPEGVQEIVVDW